MNIRTATSKPIGERRVRRETQDSIVAHFYMQMLTNVPSRSGALEWNVRDLLRAVPADSRDEETLYLPANERAALLDVLREHAVEVQ